jgi:hypothetical protein
VVGARAQLGRGLGLDDDRVGDAAAARDGRRDAGQHRVALLLLLPPLALLARAVGARGGARGSARGARLAEVAEHAVQAGHERDDRVRVVLLLRALVLLQPRDPRRQVGQLQAPVEWRLRLLLLRLLRLRLGAGAARALALDLWPRRSGPAGRLLLRGRPARPLDLVAPPVVVIKRIREGRALARAHVSCSRHVYALLQPASVRV